MKRLVVCCDGTWNAPDQADNGSPAPTNVARLALVVAPHDPAGTEQRVYYHQGVGTSRWERIRGGVFGFGLSRNVRDCYRFVAEHFEPGDEIFLFGFSRGAYTARSVAGFIRNAGVLRPEHRDRVDEAFALYRDRSNRTHPRSTEAVLFRRSYSFETRLRFVGVWDTVGALGIPLSGGRLINFLNRRNQFHDTQLSSTVDAAFHACAIDEKRKPFRPTLWTAPDAAVPTGQDVQQVWFCGVHSDVGGGYFPVHGLSDITLLWMIEHARRHGLAVDRTALAADPFAGLTDISCLAPDGLVGPHDSFSGFYRLLGPYERPLGGPQDVGTAVSSSAQLRREKDDAYSAAARNLGAYLDRPGARVVDVPTAI